MKQIRRYSQHSKQEENDYLHKACDGIEERNQRLPLGKVGIAEDDAHDIGTQIAIATEQLR